MSSHHTLLKNPAFCKENHKSILVERGTLLENRERINAEVYYDKNLPVSKFELCFLWIVIAGGLVVWGLALHFFGVL